MNLNDLNDLKLILGRHSQNQSGFVLATMVRCVGSAPQKVGSKILVDGNGQLLWGTVGGGKLEAHAIQHAQQMIKGGLSIEASHPIITDFLTLNLQKDIGMTCGGEVSLFFEKMEVIPPWTVVVFGAGHIGQELVPLLLKLNCQIIWADSRSEWLYKNADLSSSTQPHLIQKLADPLEEILPTVAIDSDIVVVTKGHATDLPILKKALQLNFPFVGVIGSKTKSLKIKADLKISGMESEIIDQLVCPIGEEWGHESPYEIALGIVAQLLKLRKKKTEAL